VVNGAYRNLTLDITAGSVTDSAPPATVNFSFAGASRLDYGITIGGAPYPPAGGGTSSLVGVGGLDTSVSLVTLPATVNYGVLILPVTLHTIGSNRSEDWTGTLVAVIPEPSSLALVLAWSGLSVCSSGARVRVFERRLCSEIGFHWQAGSKKSRPFSLVNLPSGNL
jgi:hypothetical protein